VSAIRQPKFAAPSTHDCTFSFTFTDTQPADEGTGIVWMTVLERVGCVFQVSPPSVQPEVAERSSWVVPDPEPLVRQSVSVAAVTVDAGGMLEMSNIT
jgi:hypothetical protein